MNLDIVQGVKLSPKEIIEDNGSVVGRLGVDECDRRWYIASARIDEEQRGSERACASVGHLDGLRKSQLKITNVKHSEHR